LILVDPITNETIAAGMISGAAHGDTAAGRVTERERQIRNGHLAAVVVVESDETALLLERQLYDLGLQAMRIEGKTHDFALVPAVLSVYEMGAIVIVSRNPALTGWDGYIIQIKEDEAESPYLLAQRIRQLVDLR
jgi:bifunctional enzyme CysN/CysC